MKVTSVQNTIVNNQQNSVNLQKMGKGQTSSVSSFAPSFKGASAAQGLVDVWAAIARGGFAATFIVNDVGGTGIPRTISSLNRGKDVTGKNNVEAAMGTFKREIISGPSMFVVPLAVLAASCRLSGDANKVPVSAINDLSNVMKSTVEKIPDSVNAILKGRKYSELNADEIKQVAQNLKEEFYKNTFATIFKNSKDAECSKNVKAGFMKTFREAAGGSIESTRSIDDVALEYAKKMLDSQKAPKRNILQCIFNRDVKEFGQYKVKAKDQIIDEIKNMFMVDKKLNNANIEQCLSADFIDTAGKASKHNISSLINNMENYANDFVKQYIKTQGKDAKGLAGGKGVCKIASGEFVENFKNLRKGSRYLTNITMVLATALFMWVIPKLYMKGDVNPETVAYQQANNNKKGAKS